ncbi:MAG: cytochrome C oxidase subunit IV family protein [Saprospiraceae bacterium]
MGHRSYEDAKKHVFTGFWILLGITLLEVFVSLAGKGHIPGMGWLEDYPLTVMLIALAIIILSVYKAYYIIYEFMHMGAEVKGLRLSVLMPTLLLVWGVIAFFQEGNSWGNRRDVIQRKNIENTDKSIKVQEIGMHYKAEEVKQFF